MGIPTNFYARPLFMKFLTFQELLSCGSFENYVSEDPLCDINVAKEFINNGKDGEILLIKSELGNGGTHLLSAIANELLNKEIKFASISNERIVQIYFNEKQSFQEYIASCKFLLLDYIPYVVKHKEPFEWVKKIVNNFIMAGGKVVLQSNYTIETDEISSYFKNAPVKVAKTCFPCYDTLCSIGKFYVKEQVLVQHAAMAYIHSNSIREFLGILISKQAQLDLINNKNINNDIK